MLEAEVAIPLPSPEARVLVRPAATFRGLLQDGESGVWVLLRRPLLLVMVMACFVSISASGRLSVRLIADGALSFAFVPVFEMVSLAIIARRRPIQFARVSDLFFVANAPWLLWMLGLAILRCLQTPLQATALPEPLFWALVGSFLPLAIWSAWIDFHFFRTVLQRPAGRAVVDLILQRIIGWSSVIIYFFGYAIWPPSA